MKIVCVLFISCAFTIRDAILHPGFSLKPLAPFVRWFGAAQPSPLLTIITLCLSPIPSNQNDLLHIAHSPTNNFSNLWRRPRHKNVPISFAERLRSTRISTRVVRAGAGGLAAAVVHRQNKRGRSVAGVGRGTELMYHDPRGSPGNERLFISLGGSFSVLPSFRRPPTGYGG